MPIKKPVLSLLGGGVLFTNWSNGMRLGRGWRVAGRERDREIGNRGRERERERKERGRVRKGGR